MEWPSSRLDNIELARHLKAYGHISSNAVISAFEAVDRGFFVTSDLKNQAYDHRPLRNGFIHLSAPYIYGWVLEALEIEPGIAFLNIGSGTGYLSALVREISGPGISHGIDINAEVVDHAKQATTEFLQAQKKEEIFPYATTQDENKQDIPMKDVDYSRKPEFVHGDVFLLDETTNMTYDRIYVGACAPESLYCKLAKLLKPFGILVGPIEDRLIKIRNYGGDEKTTRSEFAHVTFAPLIDNSDPTIEKKCYFKYPEWNPKTINFYPEIFNISMKIIQIGQHQNQSIASALPEAVWKIVISYMNRDWFDKPLSNEEFLKIRLRDEKNCKIFAETRISLIEGERDRLRVVVKKQHRQIRNLILRVRTLSERSGVAIEEYEEYSARDIQDMIIPNLDELLSPFYDSEELSEDED